ncbi:hypothetical protein TURU_014953 [Turdus rufiventris]|nr:hypothetical protein TURU_014953 [Turdus rufiventris]
MLRLCLLAAHALRLAAAALLSAGSCTFEDSACGYQWDYAHLPWTLHGEVPPTEKVKSFEYQLHKKHSNVVAQEEIIII